MNSLPEEELVCGKTWSKTSRDDDSNAGKTLFKVLLALFVVCLAVALTTSITMLMNRRTKSKVQLAILYSFAILTLLGRIILFLDVFFDWNDKMYLLFGSFSTYLFLMTALSYQLFILDITYVTRKARIIDAAKETQLMKYDTYWKRFVGVLIFLCFVIFIVDYFIESS